MKRKNYYLGLLWVSVVVIATWAIVGDYFSKKGDAETVSYVEKCEMINGIKYISYEQMKYIARKELSCKEIDEFFLMCGLTLKNKSEKDKWTSVFGQGDYSIQVSVTKNKRKGNKLYSFYYYKANKDYINKIRSDLKIEDSSAKESLENSNNGSLHGIVNGFKSTTLTWNYADGSILLFISLKE